MKAIEKRLEELRAELRAERISYGELLELYSLAEYIDENDARNKIEDAKQVLRDAGYYVDDLWSIHDVSDGTKEERMRVLHEVLWRNY